MSHSDSDYSPSMDTSSETDSVYSLATEDYGVDDRAARIARREARAAADAVESDGETLGSEDSEESEEEEDSEMDDFIVDDDAEEEDSSDYETDAEEGPTLIVMPSMRSLGMSYRAVARCLQPALDACNSDAEESERVSKRRRETAGGANYTREERAYLSQLPADERERIDALEAGAVNKDLASAVPLRFRILGAPMNDATKAMLMGRLSHLQRMSEGSGEYHKLSNWLNGAARLPLGRYHPLALRTSEPSAVCGFLQATRATLDATVYGHQESKDQILRILAQWVSNPSSRGHCIGIQGPMGTGKTSLVKNGIAKALDAPFAFVALGGASDGAFLEGHGFTYEGSTYGKIAEALIKTQCMNPILFFDELDKVSDTSRGEEIINILTHLTDASQNERVTDRYFGELELDLSKALMVFSYNDESRINPILRDRMITIRVDGYTVDDKLAIAAGHLLPSIYEQYGMAPADVVFDTDILKSVIGRVGDERGVRNLRRGLESIVGWLNMLRYVPPAGEQPLVFPVRVDESMVRKYLKKEKGGTMSDDVVRAMYM